MQISLAIISPRKRITGWTEVLVGQRYSATVDVSNVSGVWRQYENDTGLALAGSPAVALDEYYFDAATSTLYVGSLFNPDTYPLSNYPGMTIEFELYLGDSTQYAYADPLDSATDLVEYNGILQSIPLPQSGSTSDIFGFQPINSSSISVVNDGSLAKYLDCSFSRARVRVFQAEGADFEAAFNAAAVKEVFSGFLQSVSERGGIISFECADYLKILDRTMKNDETFDITAFPGINTATVKAAPYIRRMYGRLDGVQPVNIDSFNAAASTTNNRDWITHLDEGEATGSITLVVDHAAANTATRTFFTTTPTVDEGDTIRLNHTVVKYISVTSVNLASKYVDHLGDSLSRTITPGDTANRSYIGNVVIEDRDGNVNSLKFGRDYSELTSGVGLGFTLIDNVESGFAHTPFDPDQDKIYCRVYGTKDLRQYSDATDVLSVSQYSGVDSRAGGILFRLLEDAGIPLDLIDKASLESAAADSSTIGVAIPATQAGPATTYREQIALILQSSFLKVHLINDAGSSILVGFSVIAPFATSGDFSISNTDFASFSWDGDYNDVYSSIVATYRTPLDGFGDQTNFSAGQRTYTYTNDAAKDLHFVANRFDVNLLQMVTDEAITFAKRVAYILSDRRTIYRVALPSDYLRTTSVGVSFQINRDLLPGVDFVAGTAAQKTLMCVEVQKTPETVNLSLDDQKGVQNNSGSW